MERASNGKVTQIHSKCTLDQVVSPDKEQGGKKTKNGEMYICPVCLDEIIEATTEVEGHDAIFL